MSASIIGRDAELGAGVWVLDAVADGPVAFLLEGDAGIGKTTIWRETLEAAEARGYTVLGATPAHSETRLSFAAVGDLLAGVSAHVLAVLPGIQRRSLEAALLRGDPTGSAPDPRAIGAAFLSILSELARCSPVVVAVDDVQWIDRASARILEFGVRRLGAQPVAFVLTARVPNLVVLPAVIERALAEGRLRRVRIGPLSLAALSHLLRARLGHAFCRPTLMQIGRVSAGNPFYALEIGRALLSGPRPLAPGEPVPIPVELVAGRIAALPARTREALLVASALSCPTLTTVKAAATRRWAADILAPAEEHDIVAIEGGRIRFTHPLLASAVYGAATEAQRRRVHRLLGAVLTDSEERARHLGLACESPDAEVARVLEDAAHQARERGAVETATELSHLSRLLTPAGHDDDLRRRTITEAEYRFEIDDLAGAATLLRSTAEGLPPGATRADALWRLARVESFRGDNLVAADLLMQALPEAGETLELAAAIERDLTYESVIRGAVADAAGHGRAAAQLAERVGQPALVSECLAAHAFGAFMNGDGLRRDLLDRATAGAVSAEHLLVSRRANVVYANLLRWADDLDAARGRFEIEYQRLVETGVESQLASLLWQMSELETWAGHWDLAATYARQGYAAADLMDEEIGRSMMRYAGALVDAHAGRIDAARTEAEEGLRSSERTGASIARVLTLQALGFIELSRDEPFAAHAWLGPLAEAYAGPHDPSLLRFLPDEVEALVALGRLDEAGALLEPFERRATAVDRGWALATGARCRGLLEAARGDLVMARQALERAVQVHERLPYPFELGRTLLVKGRIHRRSKQKRLARECLAAANGIFERLGAALWADKARAELMRIGLRPPAPDDLTPTEQRVAELAAVGRTNREVARAVFLSPKTVEHVLARVYGKLGIRSRAELGARMAERRRAPSGV